MIEYLNIFNNGDMNMSFKFGNNEKLLKRYIKILKKKLKIISKQDLTVILFGVLLT